MPDKKVDHYFFTGERYIAVYEDGTSEPVSEGSVVNDSGNTPVWMDEVVVTADRKENKAEQPNWFQNVWQNGDAQKNEQARRSWNKWMPQNFTDYSNPDLFKQLGDTSSGSATPKVLQSKAIEPKFDWQDMSGFSYPAYDGPDVLGAIRKYSSALKNTPLKEEIVIGEAGKVDTGEAAQSGNSRDNLPKTEKGRELYSEYQLDKLSDEQLLSNLFANLFPGDFSQRLEQRFSQRIGGTFTYVNNNGLPYGINFSRIKSIVQDSIESSIMMSPQYWQAIITPFLKAALKEVYLQPIIDNVSYSIPIGGIQKIEVSLQDYKILDYQPHSFDSRGKIRPGHIRYKANVTVILYDTFGVSESDFTEDDIATVLARKGLASFWELQFNRGYKPLTVKLINRNINLENTIMIK